MTFGRLLTSSSAPPPFSTSVPSASIGCGCDGCGGSYGGDCGSCSGFSVCGGCGGCGSCGGCGGCVIAVGVAGVVAATLVVVVNGYYCSGGDCSESGDAVFVVVVTSIWSRNSTELMPL